MNGDVKGMRSWAAGAALLLAACSDSANAKPEQGAGAELPGKGGSSSSSGATSNGATNPGNMAPPPCTVAEPVPIAEGKLSYTSLVGDAVYYVDQQDGTPVPTLVNTWYGAIKRVDLASGQTTTVFAPQRSYLDDLLITADTIYSASHQLIEPGEADVYRLPIPAQGDPQLVSPAWSMNETAFSEKALIGIVGNELLVDGLTGLVALSLTDGSVRRLLDEDKRVRQQLVGNQLWYGTDFGLGGIFRLDVATPGSTPVEVYPKGCSTDGGKVASWFLVTSSEIFCDGGSSIKALALDGSGPTRSWDMKQVQRESYYPTYSDGDALYLASDDNGVKLPLGGGDPEYFSCQPTPVTGITGNANWFVWAKNLQPNAGVLDYTARIGGDQVSAIYAKRR